LARSVSFIGLASVTGALQVAPPSIEDTKPTECWQLPCEQLALG